MNNYSLIENLFCKRPILYMNSFELTNRSLGTQIGDLQIEVSNLTSEKQTIIDSATLSKQESLKKIDELGAKISVLTNQIDVLNIQINQNAKSDPLFSQNFSRLPAAAQTCAQAYMNKYPEGFVTYNGRYWGESQTRYNMDVKAWLMQGQNDWENVSKVKACKGRVADVLQENPMLNYHQGCDIAFMRGTNALGDSIQYTYDPNTWGKACMEFWQYASETRVIGKGDCEDKAIYDLVGAIIGGIPYELLRLVAGMTYSGEGHCSLFYFASDMRWNHRNSTTNYAADKDVLSLPLSFDNSENLNFNRIWFSATQSKTFTNFDPTTTTGKEKKDAFYKKLKWFW